jgi:CRP-like cAMP-binding protein
MVEFEVLKYLGPFAEMSEAQLKKLQPKCKEVEFKVGDKLFTQDEAADHLWVVKKGGVDLRFEMPDRRPTSEEMTVDSVEVESKAPEAKVLGWSCFVPPYKMRLSGYCVTRTCQIIKVLKSDLLLLFNEDHQMGYLFMSYMIKVVGFRFQQFQNHIAKNMGEDLMFGW